MALTVQCSLNTQIEQLTAIGSQHQFATSITAEAKVCTDGVPGPGYIRDQLTAVEEQLRASRERAVAQKKQMENSYRYLDQERRKLEMERVRAELAAKETAILELEGTRQVRRIRDLLVEKDALASQMLSLEDDLDSSIHHLDHVQHQSRALHVGNFDWTPEVTTLPETKSGLEVAENNNSVVKSDFYDCLRNDDVTKAWKCVTRAVDEIREMDKELARGLSQVQQSKTALRQQSKAIRFQISSLGDRIDHCRLHLARGDCNASNANGDRSCTENGEALSCPRGQPQTALGWQIGTWGPDCSILSGESVRSEDSEALPGETTVPGSAHSFLSSPTVKTIQQLLAEVRNSRDRFSTAESPQTVESRHAQHLGGPKTASDSPATFQNGILPVVCFPVIQRHQTQSSPDNVTTHQQATTPSAVYGGIESNTSCENYLSVHRVDAFYDNPAQCPRQSGTVYPRPDNSPTTSDPINPPEGIFNGPTPTPQPSHQEAMIAAPSWGGNSTASSAISSDLKSPNNNHSISPSCHLSAPSKPPRYRHQVSLQRDSPLEPKGSIRKTTYLTPNLPACSSRREIEILSPVFHHLSPVASKPSCPQSVHVTSGPAPRDPPRMEPAKTPIVPYLNLDYAEEEAEEEEWAGWADEEFVNVSLSLDSQSSDSSDNDYRRTGIRATLDLSRNLQVRSRKYETKMINSSAGIHVPVQQYIVNCKEVDTAGESGGEAVYWMYHSQSTEPRPSKPRKIGRYRKLKKAIKKWFLRKKEWP